MNENPDRPEAEPTPEPDPGSVREAGPSPATASASETASEAVPASASASTSASAAAPAPTKKPVRRGRVVALAACGALLVAASVGTGLTVVTVDDADRDAGAPVWRFPKEADVDKKPKAAVGDKKTDTSSGLAAMLVPYAADPDADGYGRGPDIDEFGSDAELSGRQATDLRKQSVRDLPRSQRLRLEKQIDKEQIQGMAMRSYLSPPETRGHGNVFTVDIVLSRMDKKAVRDNATFQNEFLDALDVFRRGPKIEGHKNAQCFLPPKDADEKLDMMVCSAYKGDVMVSATAYGVKPLNTKGVAVLLREQLDRIAEPGEAV